MAKTKTPERERTAPHPLNRHLFVVDNLKLLRSLDTDSVDLVVTDPPFAKNDTFTSDGLKPALTPEELDAERDLLASWGIFDRMEADRAGVEWAEDDRKGASYSDTWTWRDVHVAWGAAIGNDYPKIKAVVNAAEITHSEGHAAYLSYMAVRLLEVKRVLKPTGSIYFHCDHTAGHYIKLLMDAIFGKENFLNEIVWWYYNVAVTSKKHFGRKHDVVFAYSNGGEWTFNADEVRVPYAENSNWVKNAESYKDKYRPNDAGKLATDVFRMPTLNNMAKERTGYPTQKPVALAERIIRASSNPGDVVLDPFAGCAYVPVAAEGLGRQWIACDISIRALTVVKRQFAKFGYSADGAVVPKAGDDQLVMLATCDVKVRGPNDLPERAPEPEDAPPPEEIADLEFGERDYFGKLIDDEDLKPLLLEHSDYRCWCCGFANRYEDGETIRKTGNFHLDHVDPSSAGGMDFAYNRAPLCADCNLHKSKRHITLRALRDEVAADSGLGVRDERLLPDIAEMQRYATDLYSDLRAKRKAELGF